MDLGRSPRATSLRVLGEMGRSTTWFSRVMASRTLEVRRVRVGLSEGEGVKSRSESLSFASFGLAFGSELGWVPCTGAGSEVDEPTETESEPASPFEAASDSGFRGDLEGDTPVPD